MSISGPGARLQGHQKRNQTPKSLQIPCFSWFSTRDSLPRPRWCPVGPGIIDPSFLMMLMMLSWGFPKRRKPRKLSTKQRQARPLRVFNALEGLACPMCRGHEAVEGRKASVFRGVFCGVGGLVGGGGALMLLMLALAVLGRLPRRKTRVFAAFLSEIEGQMGGLRAQGLPSSCC